MVLSWTCYLNFSFPSLYYPSDTQNKSLPVPWSHWSCIMLSAMWRPKDVLWLLTEHADYQKFYCIIWIRLTVTIELKRNIKFISHSPHTSALIITVVTIFLLKSQTKGGGKRKSKKCVENWIYPVWGTSSTPCRSPVSDAYNKNTGHKSVGDYRELST